VLAPVVAEPLAQEQSASHHHVEPAAGLLRVQPVDELRQRLGSGLP